MICTCQSCHIPFWRYRRDWPPAGFCSFPCFEAGPRRAIPAAPLLPEDVLNLIKQHRWESHFTQSILGWYEDCPRCEALELEYAESISYHLSKAALEIATEADLLKRCAQQDLDLANQRAWSEGGKP